LSVSFKDQVSETQQTVIIQACATVASPPHGLTIFFTGKQGLFSPDWRPGEMMKIDLGVE
jgi:hypothetical protein